MIQILGLRKNFNNKTGKSQWAEKFFSAKWRATSLEQIFQQPKELMDSFNIPEKERVNLYFTVADCHEEDKRKLKEQWAIPFDIDGLLNDENIVNNAELAARTACEAIGIQYDQTGVIFSGNGVQFFIRLQKPITDPLHFDAYRAHYKAICDRAQFALAAANIKGHMDTSVWSHARLMRMPETWNEKEGKPKRKAFVLQPNLIPIDFDLVKVSGVSTIQKPGEINKEIIKNYPKPDTIAVLDGCEFIKYQFANSKKVTEPQWYAGISVVARLENGENLCHNMSDQHPGYSHYETELKINQALNNAGPRTCENINSLWNGCKNCPHFGKIASPILIHGPDYIKSKDHGYRETKIVNNLPVPGKPAYDDLIRQFAKEHPYTYIGDLQCIHIYTGTYWKAIDRKQINNWMSEIVTPTPAVYEMAEFNGRLEASKYTPKDWLENSTQEKMNFQNGVLDLKTFELLPHSPEFGFTNVLPYAYDRTATCPLWDKTLLEICEDPQVINLLEEFGGYAVSQCGYYAHKALVFLGGGSNGKSVYLETLGKIVGKGNYSSLNLSALKKDTNRAGLENKFYNYSEETSSSAFKETEDFKTLSSGGETLIHHFYRQPYQIVNKAKLIVSANELPDTNDVSHGFFRRLLIVKLPKLIADENANVYLKDELVKELPGICNKFIAGYIRLRDRKHFFIEPQSSKELLASYREDNINPINYFAEAHLTVTGNEDDVVPVLDVFEEYRSYCIYSKEREESRTKFTKELKKIFSSTKVQISVPTKVNGVTIRTVKGIKLHKNVTGGSI